MQSYDRDKYFKARYPAQPGRDKVWRAICEYLQPELPAGAAVLELGAGYCDFINQIEAGKKYALDTHSAVAGYCGPDVEFLHTDATEIDLPGGSIDVVFASNFLEHLSDGPLDRLFDRLETILKPAGKLLLVQPNYFYSYRRYWDDFTHVKAYSHESLPDMLVCRHYEIRRVEKRFLPLTFKRRLPQSYLLTRLFLALPWRPLAGQMLVVAQRGGRV